MPFKLIDLINSSDTILDHAGIEAPRLNVERMLEKILGLKRVELYLDPSREVTDEDAAQLRNLIDRRLNNEPLQYILGETEFYGITLHCDRRALIPRPETEFVVSSALKLIDDRTELKVLDLACGSGNIVIAMAVNSPEQKYYATDLSADAVALAKENAELNHVSEKIEFYCGNMFSPFKNLDLKFDMILANPPYIREGEAPMLHEQVRRYEPRKALFSGEDGLDFIREMLTQAPQYLSPDSFLISEVALGQAPTIRDLVREGSAFEYIEAVTDYSGIERVVILRFK